MKLLIKLTALLITFVVLLNIIAELQVITFAYNAKPVKSNAIIVLGCAVYGKNPSPFFKERLNEAIKLYKEGLGKYIIVSGGKGPGEDISEAEAGKEYLLKNGITDNVVLMDDGSYSTLQNLENSKKIMDGKSLKTAIIVSNKFHLKRASMIAKEVGINASYSGVFVKSYFYEEVYGFLREAPALLYMYFRMLID
ncbi:MULTISPECIES: YdcF family protein [Thermoanaerobacterium]|uniref:YdcF family protein n=1 Tax=Thermoanaerobacterium TaxID=28895 RepID=UPI00123BBF06|nr:MULTISPECIES: YdcF family protein [Thermoanaerobacterium]KAA5806402.1 YdcF family protein [Thermoanaerobacterium thermosaccharolyticum]MDE4541357.1 YdcF family protein [Thermoanaerobacterium sp. R66]